MVIKGKWQPTLIWLFAFCVVGCAGSTDLSQVGNSMPSGWSLVVPLEPKVCTSIDGDYQILGLGKVREGSSLIQTRLDVALGHTFPSGGMPSQVSISIEEETNLLNFQFGDPVNRSFSESTSCSKGWYILANDGNLIVHLMLEAQFSSFFVFKSHEVREIWSKYEKSTSSKK